MRSSSQVPLATVAGPRVVGYSPAGSLRPSYPLPPDVTLQIQRRVALADFKDAMADLAAVL